MTDIQSLINMLQSKDPNNRYEACELLRVSSTLPSEAIKALQFATNDINSDVADAAQRALAMHPAVRIESAEKPTNIPVPPKEPFFVGVYIALFATMGGIIAPLVSCYVIANMTMGMGESLAFASVIPSIKIGIVAGTIFGFIYYSRAEAKYDKELLKHQQLLETFAETKGKGNLA